MRNCVCHMQWQKYHNEAWWDQRFVGEKRPRCEHVNVFCRRGINRTGSQCKRDWSITYYTQVEYRYTYCTHRLKHLLFVHLCMGFYDWLESRHWSQWQQWCELSVCLCHVRVKGTQQCGNEWRQSRRIQGQDSQLTVDSGIQEEGTANLI